MQMKQARLSFWSLLVATVAVGTVFTCAAARAETNGGNETVPDEVLANEERIGEGKVIWDANCTYCHGKKAYPGKAPKLRPRLYKPDFVYSRIADGFRGMPGWSETYNPDEIKSVVAYVLSPKFAP